MDKTQVYAILWIFCLACVSATYKDKPVPKDYLSAIKVLTFTPILGRLFGWW